MPKELFHLWLAEKAWNLEESGVAKKLGKNKTLFLLGSIFPDSFFYSPCQSHQSFGEILHRFEGSVFAERILKILSTSDSAQEMAFLGGMVGHFIADGTYHPFINKAAKTMASHRKRQSFSQVFYHRAIESYMQSILIPEKDQVKYLSLLNKNYLKTHTIAFSTANRVAKQLNIASQISKKEAKIIILCHNISLRWLHSKSIRLKRKWFINHNLFSFFSPLIPPTEKHFSYELDPLRPDDQEAILSKANIEIYFSALTSLFQRLP